MANSITDLEAKIGPKPGPYLTNLELVNWAEDAEDKIFNLRQWVIEMGVPGAEAYRAKPQVLASAYRGRERYIAAWLEGVKKRGPRRGFRDAVEITLDDGVGDAFKKNFGDAKSPVEALFEDEYKEPPKPLPTDPEALATMSIEKIQAAVARTADAVLVPKLNHAIENAKQGLRSEFDIAVQNLRLSDKIKDEVRTLATDITREVADKIIRENLPTRLEIYQGGSIVRTLPAEARHKKFPTILKWLSAKKHVYIVGPKGTGKTHLFQQLTAALGRNDMVPIGQSLTKYDLSGYKSPTGEYIGTLMRTAIEEGHFVVIDEGDMWAAAALGFLNSALAGNGFAAFPDKVVTVHPNFLVVIAANTFGHGADRQYQGRNPLDAASLDRFAFVEVDYDPIMEKQIYGDTPWLRYVHKVREACERLAMPNLIPSMRAIDKGLAGYSIGLEPDEIADSTLWMGAAPDTITKIKNLAGEPPRRVPVEVPEIDDQQRQSSREFFALCVRENRMIDAIKTLRAWHEVEFGEHMGLKDAKELAEAYRDGLKSANEIFAYTPFKMRA